MGFNSGKDNLTDLEVDDGTFSVDADGNKVGIGTTSPSNILQCDHTGADGDDGLMIVRSDASTADTNLLGGVGFDSTDGNVPSSITEASAFIAAYAAEAHGAGDKGADLVFGTSVINDDDDTASTEHVRILDSGLVGIGTDSPTAKLEIEQGSSGGQIAFKIDNDDTDKIAMSVEAANIDADVISITADAVTTANVINITADGLTSGDAISIVSDSDDTTARALVKLTNDNTSATGTSMLELDQDSTGDLITANYGANGSAVALKVKEVAGNVATDATVTDFADFFPANCVPIAIAVRVTTAITNNGFISAIGYELGGGADPDFFTTLTDNTLEQVNDTAVIPFNPTATSIFFASNFNLRITHNAQPGAGAVRIALYYYQITAPTS